MNMSLIALLFSVFSPSLGAGREVGTPSHENDTTSSSLSSWENPQKDGVTRGLEDGGSAAPSTSIRASILIHTTFFSLGASRMN